MARDPIWQFPVELSTEEKRISARLKRVGRLFVFLRQVRHRLFSEEFQKELCSMYSDSPRGTPPLPPAMLAMVTLLQAYEQVSDAAAVEEAVFDLRWQMVLDCIGAKKAPFSQGALVDFRRRLIAHSLDRRLVEMTVELAKGSKAFGATQLRVALDSAPLWGAGRVEDTFNLIGHALEIVLDCSARVVNRTSESIATEIGLELVGQSSLKATLDIDWDEPEEQAEALEKLLGEVAALRAWVSRSIPPEKTDAPLDRALELLAQVLEQDLEPDPDRPGRSRIRKGVAKGRRISVSDPDMRHGRKSRSRVINGYKRHVVRDLDSGLVLGVELRPANEPEHLATEGLKKDLEPMGDVVELHADRGYLASPWMGELHAQGRTVRSKAWVPRNGGRYTKADFHIDVEERKVTCPAGHSVQYGDKSVARFSGKLCSMCPEREACTRAAIGRGRSISIHPQEALLVDLRELKKTPEGRAELRKRVGVEHTLAHICRRQGPRARYKGIRKNLMDLRRVAAVENLHVIQRKAA